MIISDDQIMKLIHLLREAINDNISDYGKSEAQKLIDTVCMQQSIELRDINNDA